MADNLEPLVNMVTEFQKLDDGSARQQAIKTVTAVRSLSPHNLEILANVLVEFRKLDDGSARQQAIKTVTAVDRNLSEHEKTFQAAADKIISDQVARAVAKDREEHEAQVQERIQDAIRQDRAARQAQSMPLADGAPAKTG